MDLKLKCELLCDKSNEILKAIDFDYSGIADVEIVQYTTDLKETVYRIITCAKEILILLDKNERSDEDKQHLVNWMVLANTNHKLSVRIAIKLEDVIKQRGL